MKREEVQNWAVVAIVGLIFGLALAIGSPGCSLQWKNMKATDALPLEVQQAQCAKLDSQQMGWSAASIVFGGLSGASGLVAITVPDRPSVITAMGATSVGVTVFGAVAAYLATAYTQRFCRQCANIVPPQVKR